MTQHARSGSLQPPEDGTQHPAPLWHEQTQVRQYSADSPVVPQDPAEALPVALTESGAELDQSAKSRRFSRRTVAGARRPSWTSRLRGISLSRPAVVIMVVVVLVAAGGTIAWAKAHTSVPAAAAVATRLVTVGPGTVSQSVAASGTVEPTTTADLSFGAVGQVTVVKVTQGQKVVAGQQLATISSASLASQVAQAEASIAAGQARLSTDQAAAASTAQIAADQASIAVAQAGLADAQAALAGATLTSPIAGTVTAVNLTVGQQVSASGSASGVGSSSASGAASGAGSSSGFGSGSGASAGGSSASGSGSGSASSGSSGSSSSTSSTGQIQVISAGSYVVDASVGAGDVQKIAKGDQATITTTGSTTLEFGLVSSIGIVASSGTSAFPVVISVTGSPADMYAGSPVNVSMIYRQLSNVLVVPTLAVTRSNGNAYVTLEKNGVKSRQPITVGLSSGGTTQVVSGLASGDTVVEPMPTARSGGTSGFGGFGGTGRTGGTGGFGGAGSGGASGANGG
jgi:macrolide-specific efflux system membrane fusion protein